MEASSFLLAALLTLHVMPTGELIVKVTVLDENVWLLTKNNYTAMNSCCKTGL